MPQRLAVHLSSINHRERLLSPAVAIVSGPETVSGCAVASREEERKGKENRVVRKGGNYINSLAKGRWKN